MEEIQQAHHEHTILQGIIARHEGYMFTLRGWLLAIIGGLLAAYYTENIIIHVYVLRIALVVVALMFLYVELQHMNVVQAVVERVIELEKSIADSRKSKSQPVVDWYDGPKVCEACKEGANRHWPRTRGMTFVLNQSFYIMVIIVILIATLWLPPKQESTPPTVKAVQNETKDNN
jgi:hypothetical protein